MEKRSWKWWGRYKNVAAVRGLLDWIGLWKGLAAAMTALAVWFIAWLRHLAGVEQFVLVLGVFAFALTAINGAFAVRDRLKLSNLPVPESAKSGPIESQPIVEKAYSEEKWLALYREKQQLEDELESLELPKPEGPLKDRPIGGIEDLYVGPLRRMTHSEHYEYKKRDRRIQRIKEELEFIDDRLKSAPKITPSRVPVFDVVSPSVDSLTPNLVLKNIHTGGLIFTGDEWRQFELPGRGPLSNRLRAVWVELKNDSSESRRVGPISSVRAELVVTKESGDEKFSPLVWLDNEFNAVNFELADTRHVLLVANMNDLSSPVSSWIVPLNHRTRNDSASGSLRMDVSHWMENEDAEIRLNLLHVTTGAVLQSFAGKYIWREGHSGPSIALESL